MDAGALVAPELVGVSGHSQVNCNCILASDQKLSIRYIVKPNAESGVTLNSSKGCAGRKIPLRVERRVPHLERLRRSDSSRQSSYKVCTAPFLYLTN